MAVGAVLAGAALASTLIPSMDEIRYRKHLRKERKRLDRRAKTGEGGLEHAQRQRMRSEEEAKINAEEAQQKALISRIQDPVQRQQALQKLQQRSMQAKSRIESGVRGADIKALKARQKAAMAGQYQMAVLGQKRRAASLEAGMRAAPALGALGEQVGAERRAARGEGVGEALGGVGGSTTASPSLATWKPNLKLPTSS